jgi:hypothetical protein
MASAEELPDIGTPGASARREHERRAAKRKRAIRDRHPRIGGVILALSNEPASQQAWERGAVGEERVAESLSRYASSHVVLLHDRRVPRSRANIDHIAVATSGIWVIDAKRYSGKVEIRKPFLGQPKLLIAGRDRSKLAASLGRQVQRVNEAITTFAPNVPVYGAFAFIDSDLPLLTRLVYGGYPLLYPKQLAKRLSERGPVPLDRIPGIAEHLATHFPSA